MIGLLFALAACTPGMTGMDHGSMDQAGDHSGMAGMDHGEMDPEEDHGGMAGMDHSAMMESSLPFDAQFIDGMIEHHLGAVEMAQEALERGEQPELLELAQAILDAQEPEIAQMREWRELWYPDLPMSGGMDMDMGAMSVSDDESLPYDQRFLEAMISHHQGAIDMAQAALTNAENTELITLAREIITTQQAEIDQMQSWLREWFGIGQ
jgi:uncharacterized protein (DUF305 family)